MSEHDEGKLPARSRKPVDADAQAARASEPSVGVDQLRHLQQAMEASEDTDS